MSEKKSFWVIRNIVDLVGVLGFILAFAIVIVPIISPSPTRAKLTIYVDHFEESGSSSSNALAITIFLKIVNDSPKSANIYSWDSSLNITIPYQVLSQANSRNPPFVLTSSSEADLSITKTVEGMNDTAIPSGVMKNIIVTIQYQDDIGLLQASRTYDLPFG
jgi:hypothetical protein